MTNNYRSKFEAKVADHLKTDGSVVDYESMVLKYIKPETNHKYTPDFILSNGIIVEVKGRLTLYDRAKMVLVKKCNPLHDIRFVFMNPRVKIYKGSKTTYGEWCTKKGFVWAEGKVPIEWIGE